MIANYTINIKKMQTNDFYQTLKTNFGFTEADADMIERCSCNDSFEAKLVRYQGMGTHQIVGETKEEKYILATVGGPNGYQAMDNYEIFQKLSAADGKSREETLQALQGMSWCEISSVSHYEDADGGPSALGHDIKVRHPDPVETS